MTMKKSLTLISALFCVSALFAEDVVVADFDELTPEWGIWGTEQTAEVATPALNATGDAMHMTTLANNGGNSGFWITCPATAGTYTTLAVKIKSPSTPCKFYFKLEFTDAQGVKSTVMDAWPTYEATDGAWQEFTMDITDKSISTFVIQMAPWQNAAAFECDVDNLVLRTATGISKEKAGKISVYPNPTSDFINVNLGQDENFAKIKMFTSDGKLIYSNQTSQSEKINVKSLNVSGLVFVNVSTNKGSESFKVLVK